jgi:hypothetical protein
MHHAAAILYAWATSVLLAFVIGWNNGALSNCSAIVAFTGGPAGAAFGGRQARHHRTPEPPPLASAWYPIVLDALKEGRVPAAH